MDRNQCQFHARIGACRHGDECLRRHVSPLELKTVLLACVLPTTRLLPLDFDNVYADIYTRAAACGEVESMVVCINEAFHLRGSVYVRYRTFRDAARAVVSLNHEWFAGKPVFCELSPVVRFDDAICRPFEQNRCLRAENCNYWHLRAPLPDLATALRRAQDKQILVNKLRELTRDEERPPEPEPLSTVESVATLFT